MVMRLSIEKVLELPVDLTKNCLYFLKKTDGVFSLHLTDSDGVLVYELEKPLEVVMSDLKLTEIVELPSFNLEVGDSLDVCLWKLNRMLGNHSHDSYPTIYSTSGQISNPKIFTATIITTENGIWSVDYSHVGFREVYSVTCVGISNGMALADKTLICVDKGGLTTTACSGRMMSATSAGLLVAMTLVEAKGSLCLTVYGV